MKNEKIILIIALFWFVIIPVIILTFFPEAYDTYTRFTTTGNVISDWCLIVIWNSLYAVVIGCFCFVAGMGVMAVYLMLNNIIDVLRELVDENK